MANPVGAALAGLFTKSPSSPYATPAAAYTAWATALGVSSTVSLPVTFSSTDDGAAVIDLGALVLLNGGGTSKVMASSEGGLGFFYNEPTNLAVTTSGITTTNPGQVGITRFFRTTTVPALFISGKNPSLDAGVFNFKWQKTSTAAIFTCRYGSYSNQAVDPVDISIKVTTVPRQFEVVVQAPTAGNPRYFQVFYFDESLNSTAAIVDSASVGQLLTQDVTYQYIANPPYSVSGVVNNDTGQPTARTVRMYDRTTGSLVDASTSDAVTGAFTLKAFSTSPHYVVALDDEIGTQYNDLIVSRITPA